MHIDNIPSSRSSRASSYTSISNLTFKGSLTFSVGSHGYTVVIMIPAHSAQLAVRYL